MYIRGPKGARRALVQRVLSALDLPPLFTEEQTNYSNDMTIREAQAEDLDDVQELLSSLDLPHRDLTPNHLEHFFVADSDSDIVGVVGLEPYDTAALLRSLSVRHTHRDEGLGTQLTETIEQYARRCDIEDLYLLTTTAADYFDRRGYQMIRRDALPKSIEETDEASQLCPSSATCMKKTISGTTEPAE